MHTSHSRDFRRGESYLLSPVPRLKTHGHYMTNSERRHTHRVLASRATTQIIPLASPTQLTTVLETFQASLVTARDRDHPREWRVDAARDLLPYCTIMPSAPLPQQTTRILQENSLSFRDLVDQLQSHQGRERISRAIDESVAAGRGGSGPSEGEKVVSFWACEFTAP